MPDLKTIIKLAFLFYLFTIFAAVEDEYTVTASDTNSMDGKTVWNKTSLMNPEERDPDGDIMRGYLGRTVSRSRYRRWDLAVVPYVISTLYSPQDRDIILKAMKKIQSVSCIEFIPRTYQTDYISIENSIDCKSLVGRYGGRQPVLLLAPDCFEKGTGSVIHELMHVLGFYHEHSRPDRDEYIRVNFENLAKGNETFDFIKKDPAVVTDFGIPYDHFSIMHYSEFGGSINGKRSISVRSPYINALTQYLPKIGQRVGLSRFDILKLNLMYDCVWANNLFYVNGSCSGYSVRNTSFFYTENDAWYVQEDGSWINIKNPNRYRLYNVDNPE